MAGLNFLILILCYTGGGDKESSPSEEEDNIPFLSKKRRSCPPRSCKKS